MSILLRDCRKKAKNVKIESTLASTSSWMQKELHKLSVVQQIQLSFKDPDKLAEAYSLASRVSYKTIRQPTGTKSTTQFGLLLPRLKLRLLVICVWEFRHIVISEQTSVDHVVSLEMNFQTFKANADMESSRAVFSYVDLFATRFFAKEHFRELYDFLEADALSPLDLMMLLHMFALASYIEEHKQQHLLTWWSECYEEMAAELWSSLDDEPSDTEMDAGE